MSEKFEKLKAEYRATLKSADTEEHIDLCFYRPLGFAWAKLFARLHVTPNMVTIASIFLGVGAGICMYPVNWAINLLGVFLLIWANSYDSADGQLARMTRQYSRVGRILDGMAGDLWFISIYVAICLRGVHFGPFTASPWIVWVLAVAAGICHAKQASTADVYRQFHLFILKGSGGSELDSSADMKARCAALSWSKDFREKLLLKIYIGYTLSQEKSAPEMIKTRRLIEAAYPDGLPEQLREQFRAMSLPLCKWENFMTFNWRSIFLFVSLMAGVPWVYFIIELTLFNIVLGCTVNAHEKMCRSINQIIEKSTGECSALCYE